MKKTNSCLVLFPVIMSLLSCSGENINIRKAEKLRVWMTMNEVEEILGEPLETRPGYNDTSKLMFLYGTGLVSSGDVEVYFEKENYTVTKVLFPE